MEERETERAIVRTMSWAVERPSSLSTASLLIHDLARDVCSRCIVVFGASHWGTGLRLSRSRRGFLRVIVW